jgi:hypothetical protein
MNLRRFRIVKSYLIPAIIRQKLSNYLIGPYPRIYDDRKFIYIHTPKTAGRSILSNFSIRGACHLTYQEYQSILGEKIHDYFTFSFVRHPETRFVSAYKYLANGGNETREDMAFCKEFIRPSNDVNRFVELLETNPLILEWIHFKPQYKFLIDENNQIPIDYIGRYETLKDDYMYIAQKLELKTSLSQVNVSSMPPGNIVLSRDSKDIISRVYDKDFDFFGYKPGINGSYTPIGSSSGLPRIASPDLK